VVHTAGLSAVPPTPDGVSELNRVNVSGTENLARQAADAGVRRFVFISTVKVHGESTGKGRPFLESDDPAPTGPYAISKLEAEQSLSAVSVDTGMEQRPLPFGRLIDNRRSFLAVNNLSDMVFRCLESPEAANRVFLASDDDDMSTAELFRRLGEAAGRPAQLINVPAWVLQSFGTLFRKKDIAQRLCGSLQVDITRARTVLGWEPPMSVNDSLKQAVNELITSQKA
ncbi:MAG: NAD-dependent epimerase/dehydratase family protein, partial [bacterium]